MASCPAGVGVGPLPTIWDRTYSKQNVRGVTLLGNYPIYPGLSEKGRIALPAVIVSVQTRIQQMAAKQWGDKEFNRLDKSTQTLSRPDTATICIGLEITPYYSVVLMSS